MKLCLLFTTNQEMKAKYASRTYYSEKAKSYVRAERPLITHDLLGLPKKNPVITFADNSGKGFRMEPVYLIQREDVFNIVTKEHIYIFQKLPDDFSMPGEVANE